MAALLRADGVRVAPAARRGGAPRRARASAVAGAPKAAGQKGGDKADSNGANGTAANGNTGNGTAANGTAKPASGLAAAVEKAKAVAAEVPKPELKEKEKAAGKPDYKRLVEGDLEYGPAPEDASVAQAWLEAHGRDFGHFIGGAWVKPEGRGRYESRCPASGELLARTIQGSEADVDAAVQAANKAAKSWAAQPGHARARVLYSLARHVQKHARLFAVLESLDNGKPIRETRDADVELAVRHLYHYAGWAELMETEMPGWAPVGTVGAITPWNFPMMLMCWKVCPALAAGNTVVLKPATYTSLSALLFAEVCKEAGVPDGVFNVVTGPGRFGSMLAAHPGIDKVGFTGSTAVGRLLRRLVAGSGKRISLELGGKSPFVVFDDADLDSAVEGLVDAIWFNQGQVCSAGSRLLVQENVYEKLLAKIKFRMARLRLGHPLDKCIDMGAVVDESQLEDVGRMVDTARAEGATVHQDCASMPDKGYFYPPTIIYDVDSSSTVVQEEIFGPVLTIQTFRTVKEAIALGNNTVYGLGSSVWTENLTTALEVALSLRAGSVWVNGHNMFDAAAGFGGYRESGFGRDGGKEGLYEYVRPTWEARARPSVDAAKLAAWGKASPAATLPLPPKVEQRYDGNNGAKIGEAALPAIDRTAKMYYGGAQKRPDATYTIPVVGSDGRVITQVPAGSRKDVRNAVEAARKAAPGWGKRAAHNRAQICYYIAENIEARHAEFAARVDAMTGCGTEAAEEEVTASIRRLFYWAAYADKYGGSVQETQLYGATVKVHEPVGLVGVVCPDERPLLGFVSLLAPAVVRGNAVVIVPSQKHPLSATDLYQVFDTSDVPGGVVNILTGESDVLAKTLVEHQDVDAMWYFGSAEGAAAVEAGSAENVKRTWVSYGEPRDWLDAAQGQGEEFLLQATEVKNIWMPMGQIFAN